MVPLHCVTVTKLFRDLACGTVINILDYLLKNKSVPSLEITVHQLCDATKVRINHLEFRP